MNLWGAIGLGALLLIAGAALAGYRGSRTAASEAGLAYAGLIADPAPPAGRFEPRQVAHLPEVARRYFRHAVAPGTPIYSTVEVEMEGSFLLGDRDKLQTYRMSARQALRPPNQFVWIPRLRSGAVTIGGSDALIGDQAWTRFWLQGLVPVADERTSPDLVRSARFRAAVMGALWLPTSLLSGQGVEWEQIGPDTAQVRLTRPGTEPVLFNLLLGPDGAVREVVGQRWSNANPDRQFRFQPFGGKVGAEASFQGVTVPVELAVGNHYGTASYLPFFRARMTRARYS